MQETLNLSQLPGYQTGGTLHVIINNQIGFTTVARDARSGRYCTDIAKMLQIPIFHVNGEKPEAVAAVVNLAMDFRLKFHQDVVIDMFCYRRRGHNEGDEPSYTQPVEYAKIDNRPPVRETYLESLLEIGGVTRADADQIAKRRTELLEKGLAKSKEEAPTPEPEEEPKTTAPPSVAPPRAACGPATPAAASVTPTTPTPASTATPSRRCCTARASCPRASTCTPSSSASSACTTRWPTATARWTGPPASRSRSPRSPWNATASASRARTCSVAPSATATPCCTTSRPAKPTSRCATSRPSRPASSSTTRL